MRMILRKLWMHAILEKDDKIATLFCDGITVGYINSIYNKLIVKDFNDELSAYSAWHDYREISLKTGWKLLYIKKEFHEDKKYN